MNRIFNSNNEISSRILLLLYVMEENYKSSDFIAYLDYISLYSKTFEIGTYDIHGDNPYKLTELPLRIDTTKKALKYLVFSGLCNVKNNDGLYKYSISSQGTEVASAFQTPFSVEYVNAAIESFQEYKDKADDELLKVITNSIKAKGGESR